MPFAQKDARLEMPGLPIRKSSYDQPFGTREAKA
jgi:hypothetical protein